MSLESCVKIKHEADIIRARQLGRTLAAEIGFDHVLQAQITTAITVLTRNIRSYAELGYITISRIEDQGRSGIEIVCTDDGPGIPDIQKVMEDHDVSTGSALADLPGVKRMVDDFLISSEEGKGTEIRLRKWLQEAEENEDGRRNAQTL